MGWMITTPGFDKVKRVAAGSGSGLDQDRDATNDLMSQVQGQLSQGSTSTAPTLAPVSTREAARTQVSNPGAVQAASVNGYQRVAPTQATATTSTAPTLAPADLTMAADRAQVAPVDGATYGGITAPIQQASAVQAAASQIAPVERVAASQIQGADDFRGGQSSLISQLQRQVAGQGGPSPAELQLQRATDRNLAAQLSTAASVRGAGSAAALRGAMRNQGQIAQDAASQAAELRAQEQQAAMGQLSTALSAARGQDVTVGTTNAQLAQQAALANQGAQNTAGLTSAQLGTQVSTTNAQLGTQVSESNAARSAAIAQADAQLRQQTNIANLQARQQTQSLEAQAALDYAKRLDAAGQFDASANNAVRLAQAQLDQDTAKANAELGTRVALSNQTADLTAQQANQKTLMEQAQLNAQLEQQAKLANQNVGLQTALTQAGIDANIQSAFAQQLNQNGLEVAKANLQSQLATMGYNQQQQQLLMNALITLNGQKIGIDQAKLSAEVAAQESNTRLLGQILGAASGGLATRLLGSGGGGGDSDPEPYKL